MQPLYIYYYLINILFSILSSMFLILNIIGTAYTNCKGKAVTESNNALQKYISYFSITKNVNSIFTTKVGKNVLPAINGMR